MIRPLVNWFGDLSLRSKFTAVTTIVGLTATLFATAAFLYYANTASRDALVREMTALGRITAENMSAALVFRDPGTAGQILSALKARPEVLGVAVRHADGSPFAEHGAMPSGSQLEVAAGEESHAFFQDHLTVVTPVILDGEPVGSVEMVTSLDNLRDERNALVGIAAVITVISALIALGLSVALQRLLVRPITHLADVMSRVKSERAYGQRAVRETNDELGELISGFNEMLERIEAQHKELSVYRAHLEKLVQERTGQLEEANEQLQGTIIALRRSRDELEAANLTKTTFMANMSHELRTPLNAIIGFSEVMSRQVFGPLGSERYEGYAEDISRSGSHLLGIIGQILDMTRLEAGKMEIEFQVTDLKGLFDEALTIAGPALEEKEIDLKLTFPDGPLPDLSCDSVRIRQVIINLLSNAAKFTDRHGRVSISVEINGDLFIRITDTGIGIAEEYLERVLTPFAQVEKAYARENHGAGLGLSLSKGLVEQHGGTLAISSTLDVGTTVTICLPAERLVWSLDSRDAAGPEERAG
ncbi:ATP-binding protein [Nisaea sp.]|uniref:ATP-binding protein n=1 Tax=Nisaea sp. TaxID=2024842 RepID=UPI003B52BD1C